MFIVYNNLFENRLKLELHKTPQIKKIVTENSIIPFALRSTGL